MLHLCPLQQKNYKVNTKTQWTVERHHLFSHSNRMISSFSCEQTHTPAMINFLMRNRFGALLQLHAIYNFTNVLLCLCVGQDHDENSLTTSNAAMDTQHNHTHTRANEQFKERNQLHWLCGMRCGVGNATKHIFEWPVTTFSVVLCTWIWNMNGQPRE